MEWSVPHGGKIWFLKRGCQGHSVFQLLWWCSWSKSYTRVEWAGAGHDTTRRTTGRESKKMKNIQVMITVSVPIIIIKCTKHSSVIKEPDVLWSEQVHSSVCCYSVTWGLFETARLELDNNSLNLEFPSKFLQTLIFSASPQNMKVNHTDFTIYLSSLCVWFVMWSRPSMVSHTWNLSSAFNPSMEKFKQT